MLAVGAQNLAAMTMQPDVGPAVRSNTGKRTTSKAQDLFGQGVTAEQGAAAAGTQTLLNVKGKSASKAAQVLDSKAVAQDRSGNGKSQIRRTQKAADQLNPAAGALAQAAEGKQQQKSMFAALVERMSSGQTGQRAVQAGLAEGKSAGALTQDTLTGRMALQAAKANAPQQTQVTAAQISVYKQVKTGQEIVSASPATSSGQPRRDSQAARKADENSQSSRHGQPAATAEIAKTTVAQNHAAAQTAMLALRENSGPQAAHHTRATESRPAVEGLGEKPAAACQANRQANAKAAPANAAAAHAVAARAVVTESGRGGRSSHAGVDSQGTSAAGASATHPTTNGPAGAGSSAGGSEQTARQAADAPVTDQVVQALRASGARTDRQIVVRLSPPELGNVRVTLRASGNTLRGVVEADNPETFSRLEREAPILAQRLHDAGIDLRRLDVVLQRHDGGQQFDQPQDGGGRPQEQFVADGSSHPAAGGTAPHMSEAAAAAEPPQATGGDVSGAINVRV